MRTFRHLMPAFFLVGFVLFSPAAAAASGGLQLDGNGDYVTFGAAPSLGSATFTLETWFKIDGTGVAVSTGTGGITAIPLVSKGRGEGDGSNVDMNYFLGIRATDYVLAADFEEGATGTTPGLNHPVAGVTAVNDGQWHHAAVTYNGSQWQLFLDGQLENELVVGQPPRADSIQHAALGSALTSTGAAGGYFAGVLDEVRIWNCARSGEEIALNMGNEIATGTGLIGRWALDETSSPAIDSSGSGVNGTWIGNPVWNLGYSFSDITIALDTPADAATEVPIPATLSATATDLAGDNLTVSFYGRPAPPPAGEEFTVVVLPDTQRYTSSMNGGLPEMFISQTEWIIANRAQRNIVFVTHVGDVSESGDTVESEWLIATDALYRLEDPLRTLLQAGIPYGVAVGNHDQTPKGSATGTTTFFNQYFGETHFLGRPYYGGHYGTNNDNHFDLFSASGMDFLVIHLEYDITTTTTSPVLDWANQLLQTHGNRRAIIVSHYLMGTGDGGSFSDQGQAVYDRLKVNPNLFLMLCGHLSGEGKRTDFYQGNTVHTLLADYQDYAGGGNGFLRILQFSPANNRIQVSTYSPWLDAEEIDSSSQFTLYYQMSPPGDPFTLVQQNTGVPSGTQTSATWSDLQQATEYEWYVTATDGIGAKASPVRLFTTSAGAPPGAPAGLVATEQSSTAIHLTWTDNAVNESGFEIEQSLDGAIFDQIGTAGADATSALVVNLQPGTTYYYRVRAVNGAGASAYSNTDSATTLPPNHPPVAYDQSVTIPEDAPVGITLTASDADNEPLTYSVATSPLHGTLSPITGDQLVYTPNADYFGSESFTFLAYDGEDYSQPAGTVTISVTAVNDPPVAHPDVASTLQSSAVIIAVLANDTDVDGPALEVAAVTPGVAGTVTINADDTVTYRPNAGFAGEDTFTYTASDGTLTAVGTVTVTVTPNTLFSDGFESGNLTAGGWVVSGSVGVDAAAAFSGNYGALLKRTAALTKVLQGIGPGTVTFTYARRTASLEGAESGWVEISSDGQNWVLLEQVSSVTTWETKASELTLAAPDLHLRFRVNGNEGNDVFMVDDVALTGGAANAAPVAAADAYTVDEDIPLTVPAPGVLFNDSDADGNPLSAVLVIGPGSGSLTLNADGSFTYTPDANFNNTDSFTYKANDGLADSSVATVTITVNAVNDAPVANAQSVTVAEDGSVAIVLSGSDADGEALTYAVADQPVNGTLSGAAPNLTYTPAPNYHGSDSLTFTVSDATGPSAPATVTITVDSVNDVPVAHAQSVTVAEDGSVAVTLTGSDVEGGALTYEVAAVPNHGALTGTAPDLTYTPEADYNGPDSFSFTVNDGTDTSSPALVSITVTAVNDAPVAVADAYTMEQDTTLTVAAPGVLGNDSDVDGDSLTASLASGPASGSLTLNGDGSLSYTPHAGFIGADSFIYAASDGHEGTATATVSITVNRVNHAPVAGNDAYSTDEDTPLSVAAPGLLGNDSDDDGDPLTAVLSSGPANGTLSLNADGSFTYTPAANFNGSDSFSYKANDGLAESAPATVTITVTAVNDAPVANAQAVTVAEDGSVAITLSGTDVDNQPLAYAVVDQPVNGTLSGAAPNLTYTPALNYSGPDSLTFTVSDGTLTSGPATVAITVDPVNDVPVANAQSVTVAEDPVAGLPITLTGFDVEGAALTYVVTAPPAHGTLSGTAPNLTYTPGANYYGPDSFSFTVSDGAASSDAAVVSITVTPANDPPVAGFNWSSTGLSVTFTDTSTDVDGSMVSWSWDFGDGAVSTEQNPTHVYAAAGTYLVTLTVTDNDGAMDSTSMQITVQAVDNTVSVAGISYSMSGGKLNNRHLVVTIRLQNGAGNPVAGASVSAVIANATQSLTRTGTTDSTGAVVFQWNDAPSGTYTTEITAVIAAGLTWDGVTPPNSFTK